ncbi:MFS general substrate transporter [Mycena indigotica]|uniref:MFS general substrate transporter n=1 Tax=Mycena indigotica TaxID=2126181 RepID=A0A8H6WBM2_9AGAR|nr:MFS general substrate transporter [Mycena indigotica]KAF7311957.1 MFS general substrate transporter [Mycena indigotica]
MTSFPAGMNLWYNTPILVELARAFSVDELGVSRIPTILQAGSLCMWSFFIIPLGDVVHRRPLLLLLMTCSASLTVGLAITDSLIAFEAISFLTALVSVTPQVVTPLVADLAPPNRRATMIALNLSGILLELLLARVLAGTITEFSSYRNVYWMGVGGQYIMLLVLYFITPDMPIKNPDLSYFRVFISMAKFATTEPALIQGCFILFFSSSIFSGFWVTMMFLLAGEPYRYSTLVIGLFGLVGMVGVAMSPLTGRIIDGFVPWFAILVGIMLVISSQLIEAFGALGTDTSGVGAVVVAIIVLDLGVQATQVATTTSIFSIAPEARARLNSLLVVSILLGQVMSTAAGTRLYVKHGHRFSSGMRVVFGGAELLFLLMRGPYVRRWTWLGWEGGAQLKKNADISCAAETPVYGDAKTCPSAK